MKKCSKCKIEKDLGEFHKSKSSKDGYQLRCKICNFEYYISNKAKIALRKLEYRKKNKLKIAIKDAKNYQKNKVKIAITAATYRQKNKSTLRAKKSIYRKNKIKSDVRFKLSRNLRTRLYHALMGNSKAGSAVRDLGCSLEELKAHLESKFQPGMSWENWNSTGWHIDHIISLSKFNLTNREDLLKACHFSNLQPMWALENLRKGSK